MLDDINTSLAEGVVLPPGTVVNSVSGLPTDFKLTFQSADLTNLSANGANLAGTNFTSIDNPTTPEIETTQLDGASFEFANLANADFSGLDLTGVSFKGAILTGADFTNAILKDADFTEAILTNAIVTGADFSDGLDADVFGARLDKADVTGTGLTRAGLIADNATIVDTMGLL